jgi:DNA-binding NtrC family response regulator
MIDRSNVLIIDDEPGIRNSLERTLRREKVKVFQAASGEEGLEVADRENVEIVFLDVRLPGVSGIEVLRELKQRKPEIEVVIMTAYGTIDLAVQSMKEGAADFLTKPFEHNEIITLSLHKARERRKLLDHTRQLEAELATKYRFENIIGSSPMMLKIFRMIQRLVQNESTVLIQGESGTGKELIARAIHFNSKRREGSFIPIDCSTLPEGIIESELFGHTKGSFTGAHTTTTGLFRAAEGGTLFLDEVGDLPANVQAKLLRTLQEREIKPIGTTRSLKINVRVIAATNKDLESAVKNGSFRQDLYYRLNVIPIYVLPLRERKEDIPLLVKHFIQRFNTPQRKIQGIDPEALNLLYRYHWPGNVRELENCIEAAFALGRSKRIEVEDILPRLREPPDEELVQFTLEEVEKEHIRKVLEDAQGNKVQAAKTLGLSRRSLYRRLVKYQIN